MPYVVAVVYFELLLYKAAILQMCYCFIFQYIYSKDQLQTFPEEVRFLSSRFVIIFHPM